MALSYNEMEYNIQALQNHTREYVERFSANLPLLVSRKEQHSGKLVFCGIAIGDISGSIVEGFDIPEYSTPETYPIFQKAASEEYRTITDDTIMTIAIMEAAKQIITDNTPEHQMSDIYAQSMRRFAKKYPDAGYGWHFYNWAVLGENDPNYQSYGNGAAMRAGILGALFDRQEDVIRHAIASAMPTHSHPEGIKGAVLAAMCVWMALHGASKEDILSYACHHYPNGYKTLEEKRSRPWMDPSISLDQLAALSPYTASVKTQDSFPEAIANFIHSTSFESCIRNAYRYRCDTDTVSAIAGGIAAAYYGSVEIAGVDAEDTLRSTLKKQHIVLP